MKTLTYTVQSFNWLKALWNFKTQIFNSALQVFRGGAYFRAGLILKIKSAQMGLIFEVGLIFERAYFRENTVCKNTITQQLLKHIYNRSKLLD